MSFRHEYYEGLTLENSSLFLGPDCVSLPLINQTCDGMTPAPVLGEIADLIDFSTYICIPSGLPPTHPRRRHAYVSASQKMTRIS